MPKFKDPKTGQIVNVNYFLVFLSCLLFGLFFFLYIGETQHAIVMIGFAILVALLAINVSPVAILYAYIFPFIYSFIAPKIVKDKWLKKGYVKLQKVQEQAPESGKAQYQTIIGCSLIFSGLITLLLKILPGNSLWWGITLLIIGIVMLFVMESWRLD